jgi:hypothetical protein
VPRAPSEPLYVSRNHLEGSLLDVPLERVLAACHRHLVTGVVRVHVAGRDGVIELRAGAVDHAHLGDANGENALAAMRGARDGWYEVAQRLPDLTGELAGAAQLLGDVEGVPLVALMRHCEDNALTCVITVVSGFDRACIEYRAGEIARVELNGFFDDDALPQIVHWPEARFRVAAPPLDLDVEGWPVARRAPTEPAFVSVKARGSTPPPIAMSGELPERPVKPAPLPPAAAVIALDLAPVQPPAPVLPARAQRYSTNRGAVAEDRGSEMPWIVVAAALALAAAVTSLLLLR